MTALPSDVARYTTDGTLLISPTNPAVSAAIKGTHIDARDGEREIEMFFDDPAHGQAMLDERFGYLSLVNPVHVGIEVEEAIDLGGAIALGPVVPAFYVRDGEATTLCRVRAYAQDMVTDRFSVEMLQ